MVPPRVLVAGVGNIFFGDDAFGVEVARRLVARGLPEGARAVDFGIRGLDLAYALADGPDAVVLVDAAPRGGPPGTLYVLELPAGPEADTSTEGDAALVEPHRLDPARVLRLAAAMGGRVGRAYLVGCEPTPLDDPDEFRDGLSEAAEAAVDEAVPLVTSLVAQLLRAPCPHSEDEGG
jgi:hydrogenase maturation protease